ncbi:MAG TPA: aldo/keto reductase [Bauldia sp.]|nr:aldo/keto reductase [Bauldia sp.]
MDDGDVVAVKGARIPKIGCGTWELRGETCADIVAEALAVGFRHIDTAQGYSNEEAVGEGIRRSKVPRGEVFITTKVRPQLLGAGVLQESAEASLRRLKVDVIDLLLVHWPNPEIDLTETMHALADARRRGLTRHIGVSNFTIAHLEKAMAAISEPLVAAQIEYHPYLEQARLIAAIRKHGLAITAYCPIALGKAARDERLVEIGRRHGKTAAQVALRWLVQQDGVIAIPRTSNRKRLKENFDVFDFRLTKQEMDQISQMTVPNSRLINEPQWVPHWD